MWVIFKGSLGHNSMVHWCSIPVEQGDAGSNIFDISGRLLDLPHTVPQHKCSYEFVTQIIKISKHFIIENITKQELLYMCIYIYMCVRVFYKCIALKSCACWQQKGIIPWAHGMIPSEFSSIGWDWNHDGSSHSSIPSPNFCKVDIMTNWDENHDLPPTFISFNILES